MESTEAAQIRPGAVLRLWADPITAEIAQIDNSYVLRTVAVGADRSELVVWLDRRTGLPRHDDHPDWFNTPWRFVDEPGKVGSMCSLYVPATVVVVRESRRYDPPLDTGSLPRPALLLGVCPPHLCDIEVAGYGIWFESDEPIQVEIMSADS